jgi:hypothetical protein
VVRIAGSHPADPGSSPGLGISFASVASVASFRIRRLPDHSYACPTHESHTSDEPRSAICDPRSAIRDPRSATRNLRSTIPGLRPRSCRIVSYRIELWCVHVFVILPSPGRPDVHWTSITSSVLVHLPCLISGPRSPVSGLRSPVSGLRSPSDNVGAGCRATLGASCCRPTRTPESPRPEARGPRPDASIQNPESSIQNPASRIQHPASNTHLTFYLFERNRSIASDGGASEAVASRRALIVDS